MNLNRVWMFLIVLLNFTGVYASTEVDSIATKTINGKKLIEYKVAEHEGWYGIARKYGVSYNDLRHANEELGDTLHIGQVIHVPMNKSKTDDKENVKSAFQKTKKILR